MVCKLKVVYGVQGPADKVGALVFPAQASVVRLSYDRPITTAAPGEALIYAPGTSWASGRNALMALLQSLHPDADYFVLLDHDIDFVRGSFVAFEDALRRTRPAIAFPLMAKAQASGAFLADQPVQRAMDLDEQFVALHKSVLNTAGLHPLVATYDWASWYISAYVFEYTCAIRFGSSVHQYNDIIVANGDHAWMTGENTSYLRGDPNTYLPLVKDVLLAMYGSFDLTVIEQLDPHTNDQRPAERRRTARIITGLDGQPVASP